ncbi:Mor transcription activator family protein [Variovorax sp. RKNM96]|uniref:Mor transcription activator family protein n=1 Tax=Variovorax sp. RKNM96 TaxID=2681552 RepID=UPI0019803A1C|nr:Mor transcription activator family protein [Variovorax sp. RKNM96]
MPPPQRGALKEGRLRLIDGLMTCARSALQPHQLPRLEALALAIVEAFAELFDGQMFYLPRDDARRKRERDERLFARFDGGNYQALASEFGLSEAATRRLIRKVTVARRAERARSPAPAASGDTRAPNRTLDPATEFRIHAAAMLRSAGFDESTASQHAALLMSYLQSEWSGAPILNNLSRRARADWQDAGLMASRRMRGATEQPGGRTDTNLAAMETFRQELLTQGVPQEIAEETAALLGDYLADVWGGTSVNFPRGFAASQAKADAEALALYDGSNLDQLAGQFGVSETCALGMVVRARARASTREAREDEEQTAH